MRLDGNQINNRRGYKQSCGNGVTEILSVRRVDVSVGVVRAKYSNESNSQND